ncbi:modulator of DNA gyrase family protein [Mycobacterium xenopi 3993]|nr:modulator of DNA gyrase family protein [Mycobacterium xenopi 3993]
MTPAIDADFVQLPRHALADAALSTAAAAGASHADLRVHRIMTELIRLRDGELETAVVNREIGLAVRVIVDGTWASPRTRSWCRTSQPTPRGGLCRLPPRWPR